jgi:hypothetical protein
MSNDFLSPFLDSHVTCWRSAFNLW